MKFDHILVRYGELTLKTKNIMMFVYALRDRMNQALSNFDIEVRANRDRAYIDINDENPYDIIDKLLNISGILSMSPVVKIEKN
ncbi:MAG TPA: tRNA 4-thiouridine(8) synthase ThiI, partial [Candidatus Jeotgalicoccus stercoravium]|nr:tRNA 4-thiouridine(8) synthase ThiI [Candidatus Jeotgalicoccus stercoravium]